MVSRRERRRRERLKKSAPKKVHKKKVRTGLDKIYHDNYKGLFFITLAFLAFSLITIGVTYANTGEVFYKGVSLSGGLTVTVPTDQIVDTDALEEQLTAAFPGSDIIVREVTELGEQVAFVVEAAPPSGQEDDMLAFEGELLNALEATVPNIRDVASTEIVGSSLGESFFQQTAKAVLIAFTFMGLVVFLYFGETKTQKALVSCLTLLEAILIWYSSNMFVGFLALALGIAIIVIYARFSIPSAAVILAAVSTILFTIAVVNLMEMRISTAGIAAFLMLIGYSVDTDILLSTRVLRRSEGSVYDRVVSTVKTGLTMECSTLAVALVGLLFTQSDVIKEIMTIIFIGLLADVFFTWIQNTGLLRLYLEKRGAKRG